MVLTWTRSRNFSWTVDAPRQWWVVRNGGWPFGWDVMVYQPSVGFEKQATRFLTRRGAQLWAAHQAKEIPIPGHPNYVINGVGAIRMLSPDERKNT